MSDGYEDVLERYKETLAELNELRFVVRNELNVSEEEALKIATKLYILEEQKYMHAQAQGNLGHITGGLGF